MSQCIHKLWISVQYDVWNSDKLNFNLQVVVYVVISHPRKTHCHYAEALGRGQLISLIYCVRARSVTVLFITESYVMLTVHTSESVLFKDICIAYVFW